MQVPFYYWTRSHEFTYHRSASFPTALVRSIDKSFYALYCVLFKFEITNGFAFKWQSDVCLMIISRAASDERDVTSNLRVFFFLLIVETEQRTWCT